MRRNAPRRMKITSGAALSGLSMGYFQESTVLVEGGLLAKETTIRMVRCF